MAIHSCPVCKGQGQQVMRHNARDELAEEIMLVAIGAGMVIVRGNEGQAAGLYYAIADAMIAERDEGFCEACEIVDELEKPRDAEPASD